MLLCYGEDTDPCDDCMDGADGSHKRLPRSCRLNDETELPGAEWDDAKIAEVTLPEAWQYFYTDELEPMLYNDSEDDETTADDVPKAVRAIKGIFTKMQDGINNSDETSNLITCIQKAYKEKIEPKLCDSFGDCC